MSMKNFTKIYTGNLPWSVGMRELNQYFSQYGKVTRTVVNYDKKRGLSKGYGFVTFKDSQDIKRSGTMESENDAVPSELDNKFENASKHFTSLVSSYSTEELLYFYARFKQATEGECNIPKPSFLNPSGRRKWEAWKSLSGMTKTAAMLEYIEAVEDGDPTWCSDGTGSSSASSSWARVSRMPLPAEVVTYSTTDNRDDCNLFLEGVQEGRVEEVSHLPTLNQLVSKSFDEGMTGLHWAADRGHVAVVELLLQHGAAVDARDEGGQTALHYAASCGHKGVVAALLKHGADVTLQDEDGLTARQVAEDTELLEMF